MLLFSIFSFGLTLGVFYLWLLLLSILEGPEPIRQLVRMQLGGIDSLAALDEIVFATHSDGIVVVAGKLGADVVLGSIVPGPVSAAHRIEESLVIGLGSYLSWKYIAGVLLALHLLNSYIYFGKHPFWSYVNAEARTLLWPLRAVPLCVGKVDFAPVAGIVLVFLFAELAERGLVALYLRLPL
jgi:uncharacterized protein YggT (Ycf19 family)